MLDVVRLLLDRLEESADKLGQERMMRQTAEQRADRVTFAAGDVIALVEHMATPGRKIDAIKLYRQMTGIGLKESKDAIERVTNQIPRVASAA